MGSRGERSERKRYRGWKEIREVKRKGKFEIVDRSRRLCNIARQTCEGLHLD